MKLQLDTGMYVIIATMAIFYLRMAQLRGKRKRLEREAILKSTRSKGKKSAPLVKPKNAPPFKVTSWALVGVAVVLMLVGLAAREFTGFPQAMQDYWWVMTAGGVLAFMFCFTV